ncbi:MAG TPA: bifunctional methylenetetrahydrofolate dehydrogenase/methenyltetrahydrofolate cyclohydrolase FolD [Spirochaetota bacterium]|nr:bifunctional methylenetetrahydrofolate dehydrogenase/methenyltetrahydrofolate cyclohydrolase FolD [Spirochaetota bacterium]
MIVLDGKKVAESERNRIKNEIAEKKLSVCLAAILVGDDGPSQIYVASKEKDCAEVGIRSIGIRLPADTTEETLISKIKELNADPSVNGILVQLPLPKHINEERVLDVIDPYKDVDCFHPFNFGKLLAGNQIVEPCTPKGVMAVLDHYKIDIAGKNAVVLGRSNIVGKPQAILLLQRNATVTICHSKTKNLADVIRSADIIVAAIGKPCFVTADMVKEGAVVIDVGINRVEDASKPKGYRVVGDVDYDSVAPKSYAITPVPGGIGLMTRAMLLDNTMKLAALKKK